MAETKIEWTDDVWNPVRGCTKISPGCKHCYAETFAERWRGVADHPYEQGFDLRLVPEKLREPLGWKVPRRVFVNSMSDLFQDDVPDEFIDKVFAVMALTPRHTYQILTKRADRMRAYMGDGRYESHRRVQVWNARLSFIGKPVPAMPWPLPNVWLGVSTEDQWHAEQRIVELLQTPAAVRWISAEPLLEAIKLNELEHHGDGRGFHYSALHRQFDGAYLEAPARLDWVVIGGESGPGARSMDLSWARRIVSECRAADVPVFVKQLGKVFAIEQPDWGTARRGDRKGGSMREWPPELRVRQWPQEVVPAGAL